MKMQTATLPQPRDAHTDIASATKNKKSIPCPMTMWSQTQATVCCFFMHHVVGSQGVVTKRIAFDGCERFSLSPCRWQVNVDLPSPSSCATCYKRYLTNAGCIASCCECQHAATSPMSQGGHALAVTHGNQGYTMHLRNK